MLRRCWSGGFELVFRRQPRQDDFIVPNHQLTGRSRWSACKMWRKALSRARVEGPVPAFDPGHVLTLARRAGARPDVLEKVTHNAAGAIVDR